MSLVLLVIKEAVEKSLNSLLEKVVTFLKTLSLRFLPRPEEILADKKPTAMDILFLLGKSKA